MDERHPHERRFYTKRRLVLTAQLVTTVMLDLRMVRGRLHGIARYALELAARLPALAPELRFVGLTAPEGLPPLGPLAPPLPLVAARAEFLSVGEQADLAWTLLRQRPALFHATSFSVPLLWPGKLVVTLHDANHLALPSEYSRKTELYYRTVVAPRARRAAARLTVSEFSRRELADKLGLNAYGLQAIPLGVDARFHPPTPARLRAFQEARGLPRHYFAAVGNEKPFKNLRLLSGIAARLPHPLVLLAGEGARARLGFPDTTLELSGLHEDEMPLFYAGATALLLPSRYEGFGLPALEAMASGTPVVASNVTSLPEVVGTAGVLLHPDDGAAWLETAQRLAREKDFAAERREAGLARSARFTWDEVAKKTLSVYRRALEGS